MDLQCAVSVQEADDDNKDPALTLIAPSLPGSLILKPCLFNSGLVESHAVSMTNTDSMPTLPSSPAEACLAKLAVNSPTTTTTTDGVVMDKSPTTSDIASASDSLASTGTSLSETMAATAAVKSSPVSSDGGLSSDPFQNSNSPAMLNFKGISVTLENNSVWKQFHTFGTEMILTKGGRRMFPYCRYRLSGLDPDQRYSLVLSIVPADQHKYRWNTKKWEVIGAAEYQSQGLIRAFPHQYSPSLGSEWMNTLVSFYKLKLTNNWSDQEGHMILHSMHRYIPRLHVIPVLDGDGPTPDKPVIKGPESMTFTFPQTEFITVTTYQNPWIIQLKINHNPFAKGFRDDGVHPRQHKLKLGDTQGTKDDQKPVAKPTGNGSSVDISSEKTAAPCATRAPLHGKREPSEDRAEPAGGPVSPDTTEAAPSGRGGTTPALTPSPGQPPKRPRGRPRKRLSLDKTPSPRPDPLPLLPRSQHAVETRSSRAAAAAAAVEEPDDSDEDYTGASASLRKRKRKNLKWGNSRGREGARGGSVAATRTPVQSPALAPGAQPESDDVEGLLFVSFTSKEALGLHLGDRGTGNTRTPSARDSLASLMMTPDQTGVHRALLPPDLPGRGNTTPLSPTVGGAAFVSRTGKTSDLTKIKGWRDKFIKRSKESLASSQDDGSKKKDLSAFCSNMLDEYLENEAQQISERAAAFSAGTGGAVAYQLPEKSASYVKTLDSVLKHRATAAPPPPPPPPPPLLKAATRPSRPCPLSHKPLLYSVLTSPAPPLGLDKRVAPKAKSSPSRPKPAMPKAVQAAAKTPGGQTGGKASPISLWFPADKSPKGAAPSGTQSQGPKAGPGWGLLVRSLSKVQLRMVSMEDSAENQGQGRTSITNARMEFALSALLTATMKPKQQASAAPLPPTRRAPCGQLFCRLGCVCASLARTNRGPLHCRRPDCMLGCDCFKRKIVKQPAGGEDEKPPPESPSNPLYQVRSLQHEVQPSPGAHWDRIWHANKAPPDPEPLYTPKGVDLVLYFTQSPARRSTFHQSQPILEKDKDPVYKYLESLMTCARVREIGTCVKAATKEAESAVALPAPKKPGPVPHIQVPHARVPPAVAKKLIVPAGKFPSIILTFKNTGKSPIMDNESLDAMQIEILSECHWAEDRKLVLGALCQRMKQGSLATPFCAGPYRISLIAKILRPKAMGSAVSYKMRLYRPKPASEDEQVVDDSSDDDDEEEMDENDSDDGEIRCSSEEEEEVEVEVDKEDPVAEEPAMDCYPSPPETLLIGVTPFLSPVLPAGTLQAKTKPKGSTALGLIQVNGKSYPQACLMLGSVGSLHPANRLAAHITGRLPPPSRTVKPPVPQPAHGVTTAPKPKAKAGTDSDGVRAAPRPAAKSVQMSQLSATAPAHSTSFSSPMSITVSRTRKEPSFLAEKGTYSFRICPPVANQGGATTAAAVHAHPGAVSLPGGFTYIALPKHGADTALALPLPTAVAPKEAQLKNVIRRFLADAPDPSASFPKLACNEKMPSGEGSPQNQPTDPIKDRSLEDPLPLDSSSDQDESGNLSDEDGCVETEAVEEVAVDIETVEDMTQTIEEMRKSSSLRAIWGVSSEESGSLRGSKSKLNKPPRAEVVAAALEEEEQQHNEEDDEEEEEEEGDDCNNYRRAQHKVLERLRRMEQRDLFTKLQTLLRQDHKAPKLRLLSQAQREIKTLEETSKNLEKQKKKLTELQKLYVRRISLLAGKPEDLIRHKLKEVHERRKWLTAQKKNPSSLTSHTQPLATPGAPACGAPLQRPRPEAPHPRQQKDPRPAPDRRPGDQGAAGRSSETVADLLARGRKAQEKMLPETPPTTGTVSAEGEGDPPPPADSQQMTLPLIRTKTGRIILPSSLKPLGQGYYTITIMEPDQEKAADIEPGEVVMPPSSEPSSPADRGSKEGAAPPQGDLGASSSSSPTATAEESATSTSPTPSLGARKSMSPLVEIARLNKSIISSPPGAGGKTLLLRSATANAAGNGTSRLSFSPCSLLLIPLAKEPAKAEPAQEESPAPDEAGAPVARRGRGRPRKHPRAEPAPGRQNPDDPEETPGGGGEGGPSDEPGESPVAVKRGRGRPPKRKQPAAEEPRLPVARAPRSQGPGRPPKSPFRSPDEARPARTVCSPDTDQEGGAQRPLTRGSLGKDFPSAKRRDWIDVEKELELD